MFMIIGLMLIIDMFIIVQYQNKIDQHGKILTLIHRNQAYINQLSNTANKIFRQNEFDIKDELILTSSQISQNIELLINGGKVPETNFSIAPVHGNVITQINNLQKNWNQSITFVNIIHSAPIKVDSIIKELVVKTELIDSVYQDIRREVDRVILVPNPEIKNSLKQFNSYKTLLFQDLSSLAAIATSNYEDQRHKYNLILWAILLVNLIIVGLFLFLMTSVVIAPLNKIGYLATKVANGEDVDIKYNKPDEIGEIVVSIKSLGNHLRQASDFVHHIGEGNLDITLEGLEQEKDETGSLAHALISMQNKLQAVSQEDKTRNWATRGMANFAEILRANNNNLQSLGDAILAELISYTDANIGCIYIPEEAQKSTRLQLIAFYAYDTKKHFNESVEIGEGIIGQTFVEKKTTYLLEIPEDYTHIKSGVGTSSPKSILVVPLQVNEEIYGILEIASLREFSQEQIDFIEKIGETIAGTIHNVINAEQTKKLLEDSQQLTEQMRAQEEEMRQNMEELSATQEEINRKELQTSGTLEAFDKAVATIELEENGTINSVNTVFTELSGQSKNSLIGQHLSIVLESLEDKTIQALIDNIFQSKTSGVESLKLISENEKLINLSVHFSLLQSGNALLICHPQGDFSTHTPVTELEEELSQNLNMLEVTQQSLNEKIQLMEETLIYLEINQADEITSHNSKLKNILINQKMDVIGKKYTDLLPLNTSSIQAIKNQIDQSEFYHGTAFIENTNNRNEKIMLYIEQLKNKK